MYSGLMPVMYPLALAEFNLSLTSVGVIALAYGGAGSLSQPLFGYLADRHGSRWFAVVAMAWTALMVGLAGIAPTYAFLVVAATLAGLGSGAYHPQGATNAAASVGEARRNTAMSIYTVGGTSGYALGPLIGAGVFAIFGRSGTMAIAPLGFAIAFLLWRQMRTLGLGLRRAHAEQRAEQQPIEWRLLAPVILIVMLRSWVEYGAISFVPVWFEELGYSAAYYSALTTVILTAGVGGTLFGGMMADRIGQRMVLTASMLVAFPFLILFAQYPGNLSFLFGPLFVFFAEMGLSITLVLAQRLLPGRVGVASGFILGMGFVTGSLGVPITGALADRIGIGDAISLSALLLLVGAGIAARLSPRTINYPRVAVAGAAEPAG
jgi:FSR family fosmidomycin resistance protein-like MFS transporter